MFSARLLITGGAVAAVLGLAACSPQGGDAAGTAEASNEVTVIVHDSFPNDEFAAAASAATGYDVKVIAAGDGGELTSQLVLTKGQPLADVFFGVDNTFASRLVDNEVVDPYSPESSSARAEALDYDDSGSLTAIDFGYTCINIDSAWFEAGGVPEPASYADLAKPEYRDQVVLIDPAASSVGANFLAGTVAMFGDSGAADYWQSLADNGVRIEQGWSDAYYGQFSGSGEGGTSPIVLSYNTSPTATLNDDETASTTRALLDTCSTQVEYAGLLKGAANPEGAKAVLDYLVSDEFQATIPDTMYMYPVLLDAPIPESWEAFAPRPDAPNDLSPAEIGADREGWLKTFDEILGQ